MARDRRAGPRSPLSHCQSFTRPVITRWKMEDRVRLSSLNMAKYAAIGQTSECLLLRYSGQPPSTSAILPYADVIDLHSLRHCLVVDPLCARPVTTDRKVQYHLERRVEGPGAFASELVVEDAQDAAAVDADSYGLWAPVELVKMKRAAACR